MADESLKQATCPICGYTDSATNVLVHDAPVRGSFFHDNSVRWHNLGDSVHHKFTFSPGERY